MPIFTRTLRSAAKVSPSVSTVTVTVVSSSSSPTLAGLAVSVSSVLSSSLSVTEVPFTVRPVDVPATLMVSSPSTKVSCVGVRVNVALPVVLPAPMAMSKPATAA